MTIINYLSAVDIPALTSIEKSEFGTEGLTRKDFMSFLRKKSVVCASAYYGSKTSGYLLCTVAKGSVWINRILVNPDARRKKVGSSLVAWLKSWAGRRVVYMVLNDDCHAEFLPHQDFLRHNGFRLASVVRGSNSPTHNTPAGYYFEWRVK